MNTPLLHNILSSLCAALLMAVTLTACIEDDVDFSASNQPTFSTESLDIGTVFAGEPSQTHALKAYNHSDKMMRINSIGFGPESQGYFRINVDGFSGTSFSDVEIRPNDSIFILVSATVPRTLAAQAVDIADEIVFVTNGVTRTVELKASGLDVIDLSDPVISVSERWEGDKPRRIRGSLTIEPGATLTLGEGLTVYMHDKATVEVHGALISEGTQQAPVVFRGDRSGTVITGITFDLMSRQWAGMVIHPEASACRMTFTEIRNTEYGVIVNGPKEEATSEPALTLIGCRLRNSRDNVLAVTHASVRAVATEFAEAGGGAVAVTGGRAAFHHCTFSNYYLFSAIGGPLLRFSHCNGATADVENQTLPFASAVVSNSVLYGSSADISPANLDDTDIFIAGSLIRSAGTDDDHFTGILWGVDPLFYTQREEYIFDYRLREGSPAIGASNPQAVPADLPPVDFYGGVRRAVPSLGAYEQAVVDEPVE